MDTHSTSRKCPNCGMINWATAERCKRCALALNGAADGAAYDAHAPHAEYTQPEASGTWAQNEGGAWSPAHASGWEQTDNEPAHDAPFPPRVSRSMQRAPSGARANGVIALLVVVAVVAGVGFVALPRLRAWGKPQWQRYAPVAATFSVQMPCAAKLSTHPLATRVGELQMITATADLNDKEACVVMYAQYPESEHTINYDDLHAVAEEMASGQKTTLLSADPHKLGDSPGIEFETSAPPDFEPNAHIYGRMYFASNTLYIMLLTGPLDGALVRERDKFFDSLQLGSTRER